MSPYRWDPEYFRTHQVVDDNTFVLGLHQDMEPIIEQNKRLREEQKTRGTRGEIFRKLASVPPFVYEQAVREGWLHDEKKWAQWLNDSENRDFRVYEGRV